MGFLNYEGTIVVAALVKALKRRKYNFFFQCAYMYSSIEQKGTHTYYVCTLKLFLLTRE
jgi:hypothetical protein